MKVLIHRLTSAIVLLVGVAAIVALAPAESPPAEATSNTGTVTVQIVPPGAADISSVSDLISPATLSASIVMIPEATLKDGVASFSGTFVVEDHRSHQCEWNVHLQGLSTSSSYLHGVEIGSGTVGPPAWAYEGVHAWDFSAGLPIDQSPRLASATSQNRGGCGLIVNRLEISADRGSLGYPQTLSVIIPFAP